MHYLETITIIGSFLGMFFYLASKIDNLQNSIHLEMKDFHGRLCSIEERYRKKK